MLEAKPPLVMSLFIYLVLGMFIAAFIWMWFGKIEIVVKAVGVIRPVQNISMVNNITSGEIKELFFISGGNVERGDLLFSIDTGPLNIEKTSLDRELYEVKHEMSGYRLLQSSISNDSQIIPEKNIRFYNKYMQYSFQKEQLNLTLLKAENTYRKEKELPSDMIAADKLQESKSEFTSAELALKAFITENLLSIEEAIINLGKRKNEINDQLGKIKIGLENCFVHAPGGEADLKAELMIQNKDIANIKEGTHIRYDFASLPHREYGFLTGKVKTIPGDISGISEGTAGIFIVEGDFDKLVLVNKNNRSTKLRIGMVFECRIIVREQRILDYLLEKLDFLS